MTFSKLWVYSGDRPSNGAKELASEDSFLRLRKGREHRIKVGDIVINWGNTEPLNLFGVPKILNSCAAIKTASNKLDAFIKMEAQDVRVVDWSDDRVDAQNWIKDGVTIVVRKKLTGHSGDGIVILEKGTYTEDVPEAPLYTKYVFKAKEFRVHVVNGKVIDTQQKIKDPDREVISWKVRSHDNGFIFARNGIVPCIDRDNLAIAATSALGLDFGAVDIIHDKKGNYLVLEINTAPGLEGQTVENYAKAFREYL